MGRTQEFTPEELRLRVNAVKRAYQKKRYAEDAEFRQKRQEHTKKSYEKRKIKLEEERARFAELQKKMDEMLKDQKETIAKS
jgi:hypothetical protein